MLGFRFCVFGVLGVPFSGFGFLCSVLGFVFKVLCVRCWVFGFGVWGFGCCVLGFGFLALGVRCYVLGVRF